MVVFAHGVGKARVRFPALRPVLLMKIEQKNHKINSDKSFPIKTLTFEIGFTITVPIVIFALLGRFLDKYFDSSPVILLVGIVISIFISSFLIYNKVSKYFD